MSVTLLVITAAIAGALGLIIAGLALSARGRIGVSPFLFASFVAVAIGYAVFADWQELTQQGPKWLLIGLGAMGLVSLGGALAGAIPLWGMIWLLRSEQNR